jgi:hypothetical protein
MPAAPPPIAQGTALKLSRPQAQRQKHRILLIAKEKWGKTSFVSWAPGAGVLMAQGETGLTTLQGANLAPAIPCVVVERWADLLATIDALTVDPQGIKVLGLDVIGGFERLCRRHVCDRDFGGDMTETGFGSYQKGLFATAGEWFLLLQTLDRLQEKQDVVVVLLSHCKTKKTPNPLGADYDRFSSDVDDRIWAATNGWADCILFGTFDLRVTTQKSNRPEELKKGKAVGGKNRIIYTEPGASFDAGNRFNMPPEITMPDNPADMWGVVWEAITASSKEQK